MSPWPTWLPSKNYCEDAEFSSRVTQADVNERKCRRELSADGTLKKAKITKVTKKMITCAKAPAEGEEADADPPAAEEEPPENKKAVKPLTANQIKRVQKAFDLLKVKTSSLEELVAVARSTEMADCIPKYAMTKAAKAEKTADDQLCALAIVIESGICQTFQDMQLAEHV